MIRKICVNGIGMFTVGTDSGIYERRPEGQANYGIVTSIICVEPAAKVFNIYFSSGFMAQVGGHHVSAVFYDNQT